MDSMLQAVLQASIVSKCVLVLLLFMSVASWAYMAAKWLTLRAARRRTRQGLCAFDDAGALAFALPLVESDNAPPCMASLAELYENSIASPALAMLSACSTTTSAAPYTSVLPKKWHTSNLRWRF